jgi:hypothetical protein
VICEADLAWTLALAAKPHLNTVERNYIFITIGVGDSFGAISALLSWAAANRIALAPTVARQCASWLDTYAGHADETYLRHLIHCLERGQVSDHPTGA